MMGIQNSGVLATANATTLTISSGVVTQTQFAHIINGEGDANDILTTITPASVDAGFKNFILITAASGLTITLDNGGGNIACSTNQDITLDDEMYILMYHDGTNWVNVNVVPQAAAYTPTNVTPDRAFDADTVAVAELADVVGTLIADLQAAGQIG
jgi:hypothetical protein